LIVDASVAFKWVVREEGSDAAAAILGREDLRAPSLILVELGNALWKKGMRGELGDRSAFAAQLAIVASFVTIDDAVEHVTRAVEMALILEHAVYDCLYLALADHRDDRLLTADAKFYAKVARSEWRETIEQL
jgi:predicted nucleic acid-binding protein